MPQGCRLRAHWLKEKAPHAATKAAVNPSSPGETPAKPQDK
jgi:hypothetical protein